MLQFVSEKERKFRVFIVLRVWSFLDTHERKTLRPSFYIPSLLWTRCCEGTLLLRYSWRLIHPYIQNIMPIWNQILHTIHIERIAKDVINANVMFDDINWWLLPLTSLMKIQHDKKNFKSLWINSSMKLQFKWIARIYDIFITFGQQMQPQQSNLCQELSKLIQPTKSQYVLHSNSRNTSHKYHRV